jgi:hypothetical protein
VQRRCHLLGREEERASPRPSDFVWPSRSSAHVASIFPLNSTTSPCCLFRNQVFKDKTGLPDQQITRAMVQQPSLGENNNTSGRIEPSTLLSSASGIDLRSSAMQPAEVFSEFLRRLLLQSLSLGTVRARAGLPE